MLAGDVTAAPSWWLLTLVVGPRRRSRGGGGRRPAGRRRLPPGGGTRQAAASRRLAAGRAGPIIWAALVWRLHGQHTPALLPPLLLLGLLAVVLSWTDLDVHRLPEQITLPALPSMVALLAITSAVTGDWPRWAGPCSAGPAATCSSSSW